ncbi:MAG: AmmeMemoRadiSam system protein A [Acidobacteriota bacterium]|jgi:AmmeMemoRadiSam system protein A|nr:AmmeMemoRadiSam system protein A [Acidobacteriota bacterium]
MLDDVEKSILLDLARRTLEGYFASRSLPGLPAPEELRMLPGGGAGLRERKGAFVSLHKDGDLRGCIGLIESDQELYLTVRRCVLSAALEDPRFPPVTRDEVPGLALEISVLGPLVRVKSVEEVQVGRHGIYMVHGVNRGLLLPQVAVEYGWDRREFLEQTCRKSGLPKYAWDSPDSEFYVFEAEVFSE